MRIVIRVDASVLIGTGHVMRCLVLADMLNANSHKVSFICRNLPGNLESYIKARGYPCILLPFSQKQEADYKSHVLVENYAFWLGVEPQQDAEETKNIMDKNQIDLLIVDHYSLDTEWESQLRNATKKIMVIDDLANRAHNCDILLDHNYYHNLESRYDSLVPPHCIKLLGPKHCIINPALEKIRDSRLHKGKLKTDKIERVLIFISGIDPKNYTGEVINQLLNSTLKNCLLDVVLGNKNPNKAILKEKFSAYDNIVFHIQPNYYYELIEKADLAIGAGGVSQLERYYVKLPTLVLAIADNQASLIIDQMAENYILPLSTLYEEKTLLEKVKAIKEIPIEILNVEKISPTQNEIKLRKVTMHDAEDIYRWRTSASVLSVSNNSENFSYESHVSWLQKKLADQNVYLLMFETISDKIGVVRFDCEETSCVVSIFLNPGKMGKGFGKKILRLAIDFLTANNDKISIICAEVIAGNERSVNLFKALNFDLSKQIFTLRISNNEII